MWTQIQRAGAAVSLRSESMHRACLGRLHSHSHCCFLGLCFRWNCGVLCTSQVLWQDLEYVVLQHLDSRFWWVTGVLWSWKRKVWLYKLTVWTAISIGMLAKSSLELLNALEFTCHWSKIVWSDKSGLHFLVYIVPNRRVPHLFLLKSVINTYPNDTYKFPR